MKGSLAQVIAIVAHGNWWLANPSGKPPDLLHTNSTFQYVEDVIFADGRDMNLMEWFEHCKSDTPTLRLWGETVTELRDRSLVAWSPTWTWSGHSSWGVVYRATRKSGGDAFSKWDVAEASGQLRAALLAIRAFSQREAINWVDWFERALEALDASEPHARFHDDALPARGYSIEARRLYAAAVNSYVFGGMGTWNDMVLPVEVDDQHQRLGRDLYAAMMFAFHASVNSWPQDR